MAVDTKAFIHPLDTKALGVLEAIPGLKTLLAAYMKVYDERVIWGMRMSSNIRLNERQLPDLYKIFQEVFDELQMEASIRPQCFLEMNPLPNAYASGNTKTFVVINSGIVKLLSRNELKAVIAHECGHILCKHMLYHTLGVNIANFGINLFGLELLVKPIVWSLMYWQRCSEFSCDRVAAYVMDDADIVSDTMIRLSGGPIEITKDVNIDEYYKQVEELYDKLSKDKYQSLLQFKETLYLNHPFAAIRSKEVRDWFEGAVLPERPVRNSARSL